jgi:hypothetical protein
LVTKSKPDFLGTAVERVVLNALRKRLRRLIFCASGDPLCIVFGEADPPFSSVRFGSCSVRVAGNPTTIAPTGRPRGSQSRGFNYSPVTNHFSVRNQGLGGGVGRALGVGTDLGVGVGLGVAVGVCVTVGVAVGVAVAVGVTVGVAVAVGVPVAVGVGVGVAVAVGVDVGLAVGVGVGVGLAVGVGVGVAPPDGDTRT